MFDLNLPELEQEFRQSWRAYEPARYEEFLSRTDADSRVELLARLLSAELEFAYQPPTLVHQQVGAAVDDEEEERIRPTVQLFILRFPELCKSQEYVLRLVVLEFALRLRHDAIPPNPDSYFDLCPQQHHERLIKLLELTESKLHGTRSEPLLEIVGNNDSTIKESDTQASIKLDPLPNYLGCFLLIRLIGHGGMGYVYAAIDLRSTAQVAVKVMRRIDAWSVFRFTDEFSWLSQLSHPNLIRLYDAFSDGDIRYFSMELVEGKTIREWFRHQRSRGAPNWERLRFVLAQLASAIHFLHLNGVIHRDIKCSNVMITPKRRAVLLDLGLAIRCNEESRNARSLDGEQLIGTLQYIAPEGLSGQPLTGASDWYSFGVMMYEVLVDDYPPIHVNISAKNPSQKYVVEVEQLRENLSEIPANLAELCAALINPDPLRRPSGDHILQRLGECRSLHMSPNGPDVVSGREDCLRTMNQCLDALRDGKSSVMVVRGESGMGKTALIKRWTRQLMPSDILLLSLRCFQQDHTPLRLLNMLVQELVRSLAKQPEELWCNELNTHAKAIAKTFPQIQQIANMEDASRAMQDMDASRSTVRRDASQQALASLLKSLSDHKPVVIIVDDAHWSDNESVRGLAQLFGGPNGIRGMLLLAESTRRFSDVDHFFQSSDSQFSSALVHRQIELRPLPTSIRKQMLAEWASQCGATLSNAIQDDLSQRSAGSPFLLQELFRAYVHVTSSGTLTDEEWLTKDTRETTLRRYSLLPIQAENVVQYLAVVDQPIGFHQLQMISRIAPNELQRTLSYLASQGWIRSEGMKPDADIEIAHESFRKIFLESLPKERLHRRHFRVARVLSGETPPPWPRIAHHYWAAQKYREAAACYMEAARSAAKASAFEDALFFLERAMHKESDRTEQEQFSALKLKANCLAGRGSSVASAELYDELQQKARSPEDESMFGCLAGEQWIRAGHLHNGLDRLGGALKDVGIVYGRTSSLSLLGLRYRALKTYYRKHAAFDLSDTTTVRSFSTMEESLSRISAPLTFLDNQRGPQLVLRLDELLDAHGSALDFAQVTARAGVLLSFGGARWRPEALSRIRTGLRMSRQSGLAFPMATAYFCMFVWNTQRGFHQRAIGYAKKAIVCYGQAQQNSQWETQFLNWVILACYWCNNRLRDLQEAKVRLRESAQDRSDPMSQFWMNVFATVYSDLAEDNCERASQACEIAQQAIASQSFQSPRFFLWLSRVQLATYIGDWRSSQEQIQQDWRRLNKSMVISTNHYLWLALGVRLCADLVSHREDPGNARWLRDAQWTVRRMLRLEERVFLCYGQAAKLVVDAARGRVAPQEKWQAVVNQLHAHAHHQMAYALQWHQSLFAPESERELLQSEAEQAFRAEGCVEPDRILDIILPLPSLNRTHPADLSSLDTGR